MFDDAAVELLTQLYLLGIVAKATTIVFAMVVVWFCVFAVGVRGVMLWLDRKED